MSDVLMDADEFVVSGRLLEAIEALHVANRHTSNPAVEPRLAHVRYAAFDHLEPHSTFDEWPVTVAGVGHGVPACLPEISPAELDAETVQRSILTHGGLCGRGLLDQDQVDYLGDRPGLSANKCTLRHRVVVLRADVLSRDQVSLVW
jgi:hypothetical protein